MFRLLKYITKLDLSYNIRHFILSHRSRDYGMILDPISSIIYLLVGLLSSICFITFSVTSYVFLIGIFILIGCLYLLLNLVSIYSIKSTLLDNSLVLNMIKEDRLYAYVLHINRLVRHEVLKYVVIMLTCIIGIIVLLHVGLSLLLLMLLVGLGCYLVGYKMHSAYVRYIINLLVDDELNLS